MDKGENGKFYGKGKDTVKKYDNVEDLEKRGVKVRAEDSLKSNHHQTQDLELKQQTVQQNMQGDFINQDAFKTKNPPSYEMIVGLAHLQCQAIHPDATKSSNIPDTSNYGDTKENTMKLKMTPTPVKPGSGMAKRNSFRRAGSTIQQEPRPRNYLLLCLIVLCLLMVLAFVRQRSRAMKKNVHKLDSGVNLIEILCKNDRRYPTLDIDTMLGPVKPLPFCNTTWLWPQPTGTINLSVTAVPVTYKLFTLQIKLSPNEDVTEHLNRAFALMKEDISKYESGKIYGKQTESPRNVTIYVSVNGSGDTRMRLDTDETYNLSVQLSGLHLHVNITAHSFCGARHGFETLSQLVWLDPYAANLLMSETAIVEDAPKFKYRGLMLDTARIFFSVNDILRTIDAMAANKMNTFHWHVSDSQSFPLKLKSVPQLAEYGAYGPDKIYTTEDVKKIVSRARLRGIRVLMEIAAPAHVGRAWSWGPTAGFEQLAHCVEVDSWYAYWGEPPSCQLNPRNPQVYTLLKNIYAEIINLTGVDDIFHIGGDEVCEECWAQRYNDTGPLDLWLQFTKRAYDALERANGGKSPELTLLWSSRLTRSPYLEKLSIKQYGVHIWSASRLSESRAALDAGYRSVLSHVDAWYLDCGFGLWQDSYDQHCGSYMSWHQMYKHRPWAEEVHWRVEGGEVCLWSVHLSSNGLDARVWPRAAAVAERLWSDRALSAALDVYLRFSMQRMRLLHKGVKAAPLWPRWCMKSPKPCSQTYFRTILFK